MEQATKIEILNLALSIAKEAGELLSKRPEVFDLETKSSAIDFARVRLLNLNLALLG